MLRMRRRSLGIVPDRLRNFHALADALAAIKSSRLWRLAPLARSDFDALCTWHAERPGRCLGRDAKSSCEPILRAGALYAVEIYPVVFPRRGPPEPAVYHYRALENVLEVVRPGIEQAMLFDAALPMERTMVAGAAAIICLTGCFLRHEQNCRRRRLPDAGRRSGSHLPEPVLAATALGLKCRPFGAGCSTTC